jgi:S-formylglutathione hydrolase FrmB
MRQPWRARTQTDEAIPDGFQEVRWRSQVLGRQMVFAVYLPPSYHHQPDHRLATLFLLHGSGHNHHSVLSQVRPQDHLSLLYDAILIIPDGDQGWWLDSPVLPQSQYAQYLLELVKWVDARFPTADDRNQRGICGFSMGGYGAMSLAAQRPGLFGSASSLIGTLDIVQMFPEYHRLQLLLGSEMQAWQDANPTHRAAQLSHTGLLFCTAEQAFDRPQNEALAGALTAHGIPFTFHVHPGEHNTAFVRQHIAECLVFHREAFDRGQPRI